jgi:hypothetical protein
MGSLLIESRLLLEVVGERATKRQLLIALVTCLVAASLLQVLIAANSDTPASAGTAAGLVLKADSNGLYEFDGHKVPAEWLSLLQAARQSGWKGSLHSGIRSWAQQNRLYNKFLAGKGPAAFAPDGPSMHMLKNLHGHKWAAAVDVGHAGWLVRWAADRKIVLHQPYNNEPWHLEAAKAFQLP